MNKTKMITKILAGIALISVVIFAACTDAITGPIDKQAGYGQVRISFAGEQGRTVFPQTVFDNYEYTFTKGGGSPQELEPENGTFLLEAGSWTVYVQAYIGDAIPGNLAATGSADFTIGSGAVTDVEVALTAVASGGSGIFSYTIRYPDEAVLNIGLYSLPDMEPVDLSPVHLDWESGQTEALDIPAGFYLLTARITLDGRYAGVSEAVHIYPSLTTDYEYEFTEGELISSKPITSVAIAIVAPVKDGTPAAEAIVEGAVNFTVGEVTWSPDDDPFEGGVVYTATVTLTADSGCTFNGLTADDALINGVPANIVDNDGGTVTLSYTFPQTDNRTLSGISIKNQPTKLTYNHGDKLNLDGLVITLEFDNDDEDDVAAADFLDSNITALPPHDTVLSVEGHNGTAVKIKYGDWELDTGALTVNKIDPELDDFEILGIDTYAYNGSARTVAANAKEGKTTGDITVKYNDSETSPVNAGNYTVTLDVAADVNYNAKLLTADTLIISKLTPVAGDYDISGTGTFDYNGSPRSVTVSAKAGGETARSPGTVTVKYNSSETAPTNANSYTVTFDVAGTTNWNAATGLTAGTLTISKATPVAGDYEVNGTVTFTYDGSAKSVTVSVKSGGVRSDGGVTVKYNGGAAPTNAGSYPVTFDVAGTTNWNATTNLSTGTSLTINKATPVKDDYTIDGLGQFSGATGGQRIATVTVKSGGIRSDGSITVKYNGSSTAYFGANSAYDPFRGIIYVTFDVAETANWNAATLNAGIIQIYSEYYTTWNQLDTYMSASYNNPPIDNPIYVAVNTDVLPGTSSSGGSGFAWALYHNSTKYAYLDFSFSTFTTIGSSYFANVSNLTGIVLPSTLETMENLAFMNCNNLTSVTFMGVIPESGFAGANGPFYGSDLKAKYLEGGPGTYTRSVGGETWTKQ